MEMLGWMISEILDLIGWVWGLVWGLIRVPVLWTLGILIVLGIVGGVILFCVSAERMQREEDEKEELKHA